MKSKSIRAFKLARLIAACRSKSFCFDLLLLQIVIRPFSRLLVFFVGTIFSFVRVQYARRVVLGHIQIALQLYTKS